MIERKYDKKKYHKINFNSVPFLYSQMLLIIKTMIMNTSDPIMAFRMTSLHEHGHSLGTRNKNTRLPQLDSFYKNMLMWPKIRHFF